MRLICPRVHPELAKSAATTNSTNRKSTRILMADSAQHKPCRPFTHAGAPIYKLTDGDCHQGVATLDSVKLLVRCVYVRRRAGGGASGSRGWRARRARRASPDRDRRAP